MSDFESTQSQMSEDMDIAMKAAINANKKRAQKLEIKRRKERERRLKKKKLKNKEIQQHLNVEDGTKSDVGSSQVNNEEEFVFRYSDDECATLASFVDKNYTKLFGKLSGPSYKAAKEKTWEKCVEHMNDWHRDRKKLF